MVKRLLTCFYILFCSVHLFGQLSYRFNNFTISEGLSQSSVTAIVQDKVGTLWIGTQDGLNRFDGQQFEVFNSDNTEGLQNGYIQCAHISNNNDLWFGTANGLTKYDSKKETFKTYLFSKGFYSAIENIDEDNEGTLWMASNTKGLLYFNKKKKKIAIEPNFISKKLTYLKFVNKDELLLSSEDKGTFIYNVHTKKSKIILPKKANSAFVINDAKLFWENNYIIASNVGMWIYNIKTYQLKPFLSHLEKEWNTKEFSSVHTTDNGDIYIGTVTKGLITLKKENDKYRVFQTQQDNMQQHSLLYNEINNLFCDKYGTIWLGTLRGLSSFHPQKQGFQGVGPSANSDQGLRSESVWSFVEDRKAENVFVATDFAVTKINRKTGKFTHYDLNGHGAKSSESSILTLYYVNENKLLVGCNDGLYELAITGNSYKFKNIPYKGITNPPIFEKIYRIEQTKDGSYFLATKGGVLKFDEKTKKFDAFVFNPKNSSETIGFGICRLVYKSPTGQVYFATSSGGIYLLEKGKDKWKIKPYQYNKNILAISKDYVCNIFQQNENKLWLGTSGSGLLELDVKTGNIKKYTRKEGLPNNFVYCISSDSKGNLWLSTNKGLCKFNTTTKKSINFTDLNGLLSNEFNTNAYMKSKTGELFFGGILGYNSFNPDKLITDKNELETHLLKLKFKNDWLKPGDPDAPFTNSFSESRTIHLKYNQRSFSIRFVNSDLGNAKLIQYKYILRGDENEEVFLGSNNEIHFNSLSPGDYRLELYSRKLDGQWSASPTILSIEIAKPFWLKWWFWVLSILVLALFVRFIIKNRIQQYNREQIRLEMKITQRTKEIREQNIKIEEQRRIIEKEKNKVEAQRQLLQIQKDKTESVLNNVIPTETAKDLVAHGKTQARAYKMVSVLFTDFVGFTKIAEQMEPSELVKKLDVYFTKFDEIIANNNLEKIKTIGDAYMCAGGVPVRNSSNPWDATLAALQIQDYMQKLKFDAIANEKEYWELRLGINTGEVTAGVIGSTRLAYDIWGSTVNQAQRMENMGEVGKVTITGATFQLIEPYFDCTYKGKVKSKSKGMIDMFTVDRIKPELSVNGEGLIANERFHQIVNLHLYSSINYYKAEKHIMKVLKKGLDVRLHYHGIQHTQDVVKAVERYALMEGVTDEGLFILKSAATYHDAGFVEKYDHNEPVGARMAEEILPQYGYTQEDIDKIKELIYVTQIPHQPKSLLEEIICDADLDYLGRDDFHEIADRLRRELKEHGKINSDRAWDEMQVKFLTMHKYFTATAKASREAKKQKNLEEVKERLERNIYED
jgi:ligand-binding sensor domain-containing protein/class 3 adenylate cyclase/predicted metal-dependent HD superfamily phosphohydrolase